MKLQIFKKKSLIYVFREIALIFIGITIAIWVNNWNEARKSRISEIETLTEIKKAIEQDLNDILLNLNSYRGRIFFHESLLNEIEELPQMSEELSKSLVYIEGFASFISNIGPYETLKSRGLEQISNHSIRLDISSLYDVKYEVIKSIESISHEHYFNYIKPYFIKKLYAVNKSYHELKNDNELKQYILWDINLNNTMLDRNKILIKELKLLIEKIEAEINNLKN